MKCTNEDIGQLISLYEFGQISEEKRKLFEAHLLECDYCFQSLHELSPAVEKMRDHPEIYLPALQENEQASIFETFRNWIKKTLAGWLEVPERLRTWGKVALPVVAGIAALLLFMISTPSDKLSDLARIEPVPYKALQLKGATSANEAERLFEEGMQFYVEKKYGLAIEKLSLAVEKNPDNVSFQFYLGLNYLFAENVEEAIDKFERVIELGSNSLLEKAHWYLGNAYLLQENGTKALEEFEKVVEMEGDYEWEAREMIGEIEKMKLKKNN